VTMHIKNIFSAGELNEAAVCKKCLQTAADGKNYEVSFYSLDMPEVSVTNKPSKRREPSMSNTR
jgi:hypothetical protein